MRTNLKPKTRNNLKKSITLLRILYEEPYHLNLIIQVSDDQHSGELEFYMTNESFIKCANELENFPDNKWNEVLWELGSENPQEKFAFFFRFHVVFVLPNSSKIHIRLCNHSEILNPDGLDFVIESEVDEIKRLGRLWKRFSSLQEMKIQWP